MMEWFSDLILLSIANDQSSKDSWQRHWELTPWWSMWNVFILRNSNKCVVTCLLKNNKNTLTGLANCKKTTRHHAYLSLCAKSRKTNDAKLRKWPKTSIWAIFWQFRGQISPNCKFFWKIGFIQIESHI